MFSHTQYNSKCLLYQKMKLTSCHSYTLCNFLDVLKVEHFLRLMFCFARYYIAGIMESKKSILTLSKRYREHVVLRILNTKALPIF